MAEPSPVTEPSDGSDAPGDQTSPGEEQADPAATARLRLPEAPSSVRLFGSHAFFRLWLAQVVSSLGDWLGLVAIIALAARVGGSSPDSAIGLVMSARMIPGFFLAPVAGVLVDRWDRRRVMVACDIGRGAVLATVPFVDTIVGLVMASLLLEIFTLLWAPAKEASVPKLVPAHHLSTANSLSLVAAYGTFPIAGAVSALLFKVAEWLSHYDALDVLRVNRESVALYFDVGTFLLSALLISTLTLSRPESGPRGRIDLGATFRDLKEGFRYIGTSPVVRSVMVGLGTGLFGGAMIVPLGITFSTEVVGAGAAGFSLLLTALGLGVAAGVVGLSAVQRRVPRERVFVGGVLGGGVCILAGASMSTLLPALLCVAGLGMCAGTVYVVGFTILQENVADELRGRIFATLYTLIRLCVLLALAVGPFLSELLGRVSSSLVGDDLKAEIAGTSVALPGVRLTLWFAGLVLLVAGTLAARALRTRSPSAGDDTAVETGS